MTTISGHMIIKNGIKFDYPFVESCLSILPICDEFVFLEGFGDDGTYERLTDLQRQYPDKIRLHRCEWKNEHWSVLSEMTNHCIKLCQCDYHFQIQADEAVNEIYHKKIKSLARKGLDFYEFGVYHFFSGFNKIYQPGVFYDTFMRMARRDKYPSIRSYGDAMSLGCPDTDSKRFTSQNAIDDVKVYHYGYVRKPKALIEKQQQMTRWWGYQELDSYLQDGLDTGTIKWMDKHKPEQLRPFGETHPSAITEWAKERNLLVESGRVE